MKVIVGSGDLWLTPDITGAIVAIIASIPPGDFLGIRASMDGEPASPIERFVATLGSKMARGVVNYEPRGGGRHSTFERDYRMVEEADVVFAFFAPEREMEGGTGHVVKAALDREVPVEAYALDDSGALALLGSDTGNPSRPSLTSRPEVLERMWEEAHA